MPLWRALVAIVLQVLALFAANPALAAPNNIRAELVAESAGAPGATVTLAFAMTPAAGWHGYWLNPGDAGLGMGTKWTLPAGAKVGALEYPVPTTLLISGLMNHVYKAPYAVLVPFTVPAGARPGERLPLRVEADWLACTDTICVPERAVLETTVTVGPATSRDPRFDEWRRALPAPLGAEARFAVEGQALRLAVPIPAGMAVVDPHVFAAEDRVVDYAANQSFAREGDLMIVDLVRARRLAKDPDTFTAVLRLNPEGDGVVFTARPGPVPKGGMPLAKAEDNAETLPALLLAALLGGVLLNVMPCVFPILSLKALSLARAGESEAQARAEGLAYTAGVVIACAGLGAALLALRAGGSEIGWAFQLQEPLVVAALLLLALAITANLLGFYEFAVPGFASEGSRKGAFATGLLAAFVATPCTGPFMAAAMGAALLLPVPQAMALFTALGLGIALPFLAIAFVPALRRRLPRPGPWMGSLRRWMALPMGLTALALAWLAQRTGGLPFLLGCGVLGLGMTLLLVHAGRLQRRGEPAAKPLFAGLAGLGVLAAAFLPVMVGEPQEAAQGLLPSRPYSAAALSEARASGKPVFAYFTADWCLTCKVNEAAAIEREDTRDAFARAGVVVLRGDWTRRDPEITRFLTEQGAAGVPLTVWYPAGGGVQKLPQVLTPAMLTELAGQP